MLALRCTPTAASPAAAGVSSRRSCVVVAAAKQQDGGRRSVLLSGAVSLAGVALFAARADARDYKDALAQKEARKAKLREAAGSIKESGKDQQVFKKSEYSLPDDAHTPNTHTRQNEGARTQENV